MIQGIPNSPSTGIIILAAGASTRMGEPKQLLRVSGESLLQRVTRIALSTPFRPVIVVLGAHRTEIEPELVGFEVLPVFNPDWSTGMGSSIATGVKHLLHTAKECQEVFVLVGDQPLLDSNHLLTLQERKKQGNVPMAVSRYAATHGVPALFDQSLFGELLELNGAQGAKPLIQKYLEKAIVVDFEVGLLDIDTPEDWAAFLNRNG